MSTQVHPQPHTEQPPAAEELLGTSADDLRASTIQPRLVVGLALIAGGLVWAVLRGLEFYGANPVYDVDQPPLMLLLVGVWLVYRSRLK